MEKNHRKLASFNVSMRKLALTVLVVVSTLFAANANEVNDNEKEITVTSLGASQGDMMFNLKYKNDNGDKLSIMLVDGEGTRLYKEVLNDKSINRTFKTPSDIGTLVLVITNTKDKTEQRFEIKAKSRLVEKVLITTFS